MYAIGSLIGIVATSLYINYKLYKIGFYLSMTVNHR